MSTVSELRSISNAYTPRVNDTVSREVFRMPAAFELVRDVTLPRGGDTLAQVRAVEGHYRRLTGRDIPVYEAIRLLDQIKADRAPASPYDPRPIAVELILIAEWLVKNQYGADSVYLAIRGIERTGTAYGSMAIDGEDQSVVEGMIPEGFVPLNERRFSATV
jgi:hypothetical protein